jgi:hypothetical protein
MINTELRLSSKASILMHSLQGEVVVLVVSQGLAAEILLELVDRVVPRPIYSILSLAGHSAAPLEVAEAPVHQEEKISKRVSTSHL